MKRNPYLAAILNAFLHGLGYIYLGKRILFGLFLIFSCISAITFIFADIEYGLNILSHPLIIISILFSCLAFAYDAFKEADVDINS